MYDQALRETDDGRTNGCAYVAYRALLNDGEQLEFPIEQAPPERRFLMLVGLDDQWNDADRSAQRLQARLRRADPTHADERLTVVCCVGAGHNLDCAYMPHCEHSVHTGT